MDPLCKHVMQVCEYLCKSCICLYACLTSYASIWMFMQVMYMLKCKFNIICKPMQVCECLCKLCICWNASLTWYASLCKYMNAYASMWVLMQVKYMLKCKFYMLCKSHVWWYVSSYATCYANHMFDDM